MESIKVAHLQSEFAMKYFLSYEFSHEKSSEVFPEIFEPLICGSKKKFADSQRGWERGGEKLISF